MTAPLLDTPGISRTSQAFRLELPKVAERLGTDPNYLAAVMSSESGFRPDIVNPVGGATGLIQWMPNIAPLYGTTTAALRCMTDVEQLAYVEKFYRPYKGKIDSPGTAYMLTFLPAFAQKPDDFVLGRAGDTSVLSGRLTLDLVYRQNSVFDRAKKGYFTVGDVKQKADGIYRQAQERGVLGGTGGAPKEPAPPATGASGAGGSSSSPGSPSPGSTSLPVAARRPTLPQVDAVTRVPSPEWKPLQEKLLAQGLYHGKIDGDPGPKTCQAIVLSWLRNERA